MEGFAVPCCIAKAVSCCYVERMVTFIGEVIDIPACVFDNISDFSPTGICTVIYVGYIIGNIG